MVEYVSTMEASTKRTARVIGKQVAAQRARRGWTRPELADRLDIDRTHVWRIEKGEALPSLDLLDRMSRLFGVGLDELRGRAEAA
jgi:transcriptional regulator with XRE-family HTH domain